MENKKLFFVCIGVLLGGGLMASASPGSSMVTNITDYGMTVDELTVSRFLQQMMAKNITYGDNNTYGIGNSTDYLGKMFVNVLDAVTGRFGNIYENGENISDKYVPYSGAVKNVDLNTKNITTSGIMPVSTSKIGNVQSKTTLGNETNIWHYAYFYRWMDLTGNDAMYFTGNAIGSYKTFFPTSDDSYDLGTTIVSSPYRWRNLYLSGDITDYTDSFNVAQIGDLLDTFQLGSEITLILGAVKLPSLRLGS